MSIEKFRLIKNTYFTLLVIHSITALTCTMQASWKSGELVMTFSCNALQKDQGSVFKVQTLVIRLRLYSVWKLLPLAVSLLLFLNSVCITLWCLWSHSNLKVWCSYLSDMFLWIRYCIWFFVPKPWSPMCITWWSISNLYNMGLVGECYIEIAFDSIWNDEILQGSCHHA